MYIYITAMTRTQIYLGDEETAVLDRIAKQTGRSRSQLIREAISGQYVHSVDPESLAAVLERTAGCWKGQRPSGAAEVERLRPGRLAKLHVRKAE